MNKDYYAIIMAGGIGSRFWPISRTSHPKQFIDILGTGKTLIQNTYDRFLKICPKENIYIVTNENYLDLVRAQLPDMADQQILTEPVMRNTAPCIAYGCFKIESINPNASIVVAPSDHLILDEAAFITAIEKSPDFTVTSGPGVFNTVSVGSNDSDCALLFNNNEPRQSQAANAFLYFGNMWY